MISLANPTRFLELSGLAIPWLAAAAVIGLAYVALLHVLGAVEPDEWRFFSGLLGRGRGSHRTTLPVETAAGATAPAGAVDGGYER